MIEVSLEEYNNLVLTASDTELKQYKVRDEDKFTCEELIRILFLMAGSFYITAEQFEKEAKEIRKLKEEREQ